MSANVETMFSVRETPWHGLGTIIKEAPTSAEAIRLAGLDWNVIQSNLIVQGTLEQVKGYKVNIRESDGKILGIVTDRYRIVQNAEAFAWTDALLGEGVTYETAGSLSSGRKVWMLARLEGRKLADEIVDPYLVFTNSHDGTGAIRVAITPVRVVCQNTLNLALDHAARQWSCHHIGDIRNKMQEAKDTLIHANTYLDALDEEFGELKGKKMTDDKVREYVAALLPVDEEETDRKKANILEMRDDLLARYFEAPDLADMEKSAFRFVNAVSDFATHREPGRRMGTFYENRFMSTVDGNAMIDKAYAMVGALV